MEALTLIVTAVLVLGTLGYMGILKTIKNSVGILNSGVEAGNELAEAKLNEIKRDGKIQHAKNTNKQMEKLNKLGDITLGSEIDDILSGKVKKAQDKSKKEEVNTND
jgi:hypothetical protein